MSYMSYMSYMYTKLNIAIKTSTNICNAIFAHNNKNTNRMGISEFKRLSYYNCSSISIYR